MSKSEFEDLDDQDLLNNITNVIKYLGGQNVKISNEISRIIYVYYDLIKNKSGNFSNVKLSFYNIVLFKI